MPLARLVERLQTLPGAPGCRQLDATLETWRQIALDVMAAGGRLLSLWTEIVPQGCVSAAYLSGQHLIIARLSLRSGESTYPRLDDVFPCADRLQRAAADLTGIRADGADQRAWLRHAAWPPSCRPLGGECAPTRYGADLAADDYPFVRVAGDGVHEIAVGPVHAGIIEPGHFRFSVVGEKVLKLEERLGYVHKGIERRFEQLSLHDGHRLAARVSGDTAVGFSWAYCQAFEGLSQTTVPPRAVWLRALALEAERIANHLGDLGALANDAGFAFGLAQCSRLKELWLRSQQKAFGQRYLLDFIVPGGVVHDVSCFTALDETRQLIARTAQKIRGIYEEHAGVRDRFADAGVVRPELARQLGLIGLAGRGSGQDYDLRADCPCPPYDELTVRKAVHTEGDVAARVAVRFDELFESLRLIDEMRTRLPDGPHRAGPGSPLAGAMGVGLIEAWRGPVMLALVAGDDGHIRRCHPHDPSWQNWPVLEHAVIGNIVPDFPLINKSFNLSYSGHDL